MATRMGPCRGAAGRWLAKANLGYLNRSKNFLDWGGPRGPPLNTPMASVYGILSPLQSVGSMKESIWSTFAQSFVF